MLQHIGSRVDAVVSLQAVVEQFTLRAQTLCEASHGFTERRRSCVELSSYQLSHCNSFGGSCLTLLSSEPWRANAVCATTACSPPTRGHES